MISFDYIIKDRNGMHARPAGMLVKEAGKFGCEIKLVANGKEVNAKKIFGVMSLNAKCGDTIKVIADGSDEEQAMESVKTFLENNL